MVQGRKPMLGCELCNMRTYEKVLLNEIEYTICEPCQGKHGKGLYDAILKKQRRK